MAKSRKIWFFVSHLEEVDRPSPELLFEIQLLNSRGEAIAFGYVGGHTEYLEIQGQAIPLPVIEAAIKQPLGNGDYVGEDGNSVHPYL